MVAPLLFLLTFGLIEFGRMTMVKHATIEASRVGARVATLPSATIESVTQAVDEQLDSLGMPDGTVVINPADPKTVAGGQPITVTVSVSTAEASWLPFLRWITASELGTATTMRRETTF
jgi:Flp pilus assembly protein TadG